jgi:predicted transcriptional regulator
MIASWLDPSAGTRGRRPALGSLVACGPRPAGGSLSHCCKSRRDSRQGRLRSSFLAFSKNFATFLTLKTNVSNMSTASLLVEINPKVKDRLDHLKLHPEESYSDVIDRIASIALEEEPLDQETQERIMEALNDLKEGRYLTSQEIRMMLESS